MKEELEKLLDKYWDGETSLQEEKRLRLILSQIEGYQSEKAFFLGIEELSNLSEKPFSLPVKTPKSRLPIWMNIAAGLIILFVSGIAIWQYQQQEAEKQAYLEVMQAFALINAQLEKGTNSMQVMEDFKHLNTPQELFQSKEKN
ncbi:hypothetical protein MM236_05480 [Belliella sp. DSM 107340]|uniref:Anti-sigma factor n=1 Tax=Belliella calami TaxID=2923436 RepID=A0ABS9ULC0_9BACT|nr:hypothetical protein [Belliella calami]MCH7397427.1 hypothetical protein [Belliella calami]